MATALMRKVKGGTATARLLSAYVAFVLAVAVAGPGVAVFASEGDASEAMPPELTEPVVEEAPPTVEPEPAVEPEPVVEPVEAVAPAEAPVAEASVEGPSSAAAVDPAALVPPVETPDDNPPLTAGGVRIQPVDDGTYYLADFDEINGTVPADMWISIDEYFVDDEGWYFDWESNYPMLRIVVKGGNAANEFTYSPPPDVYGDAGLYAPVNASEMYAGLSHLDFYFGDPAEEETGDLIVYKFEDLDEDGVHDEGEPMLEDWEFSLYEPELEPTVAVLPPMTEIDSGLTDEFGELLFDELDPGMYYVTETLKSGWTNTTPLTQGVEVVEGETAELWFGNVEEFLPFTELDLAITKAAGVVYADPGEIVTYTLTYWNNGELPATDFTIVDDFDERYVTVVNANGGVVSGGKITWTLPGPLAMEDGKQTLTYTVRVDEDMPDGTTNIDNVVVISHPLDSDPTNNTDNDRIIVGEPFLPFTGGELGLILGAALVTAVLGLVLRRRPEAAL